jgi:hypothetical protein
MNEVKAEAIDVACNTIARCYVNAMMLSFQSL